MSAIFPASSLAWPASVPRVLLAPATASCGASAGPMPWPGITHEVFCSVAGEDVGRRASAAIALHWARGHLGATDGQSLAAWIGRRTWPYPRPLWRCGLMGRSVFMEAADALSRLWAAELAMRSPAVGIVIADGSGFNTTATRRLQLIARNSRALLVIARPAREERWPSAAGARWRITPVPSPDHRPRWRVDLLRCKGTPSPFSTLASHEQLTEWTLAWEGETATARIVAPHQDPAAQVLGRPPDDLGDRSDAATGAARRLAIGAAARAAGRLAAG